MAPTGSSTRITFSTNKTPPTTRTPAIAPIRTAPIGLTKAQPAEIATAPARSPLHVMVGSGLPKAPHIVSIAEIPLAPVASRVHAAIEPTRRSVRSATRPTTRPDQPKIRIKVPTAAIGML